MAPQRWKPLPEIEAFLEYNEDMVRCGVCYNVGKVGLRGWISRKNLKAHLNSPTHLGAYDTEIQRGRMAAEEQDRLSQAYGTAGAPNLPDIHPSEASQVPQMFPQSEDNMDIDSNLPPINIPHLIDELGEHPQPGILGPEETRLLLQQEFERMLEDAYQETHLGAGVEDQFIADELPKAGDDEDEEDAQCFDSDLLQSEEYFPYPNKTVMLLDIMDNLPRCRFTGDQLSLILHFARKLGVADVPSLKGFRKTQLRLQLNCGNKPVKSISHLGNVFYMNDIRATLASDMANPLVAPHLHFYPEETDGPISETFQAERWMEYSPSQLTPMYSRGQKRFWIEEVAQLADGRYVIPHTWIWVLKTDVEETFKAVELELDFNDIRAEFGEKLAWVDETGVPAMPNSMRNLVGDDEDLFVLMVSPWADDVSGNRSKQYNKHMNMCTGNGCLPGRLLQQEFHIHYVSTSPHASSAEQFATFRDHVKSTETEPVECFNAATKRKCRFIIRTPGLTGDNPQQSEEASHMGGNANFPCRKCGWVGQRRRRRPAAEIRDNLAKHLEFAMRGDKKGLEDLQRSTGTKDKITQHWIEILLKKAGEMRLEVPRPSKEDIASRLQTWLDQQTGDKFNPLLDITGLDPSQDTPVELLHTVLLGVMKYIWHMLNTSQWSDADRHLFAIRLQSTDISGLTVPPIRAGYIIQYRNNLIGKHFKTMMQFTLIKAAGELGARLWVPEIDNMDEYLDQLNIAVANLLDAFDAVDPLRILVKIKLHLLVHIPDDIRRFGPAIRFATEIYEAFNGVFRLCSIYSNRLAPSRDISQKFASMDRVKHILSGGYWADQTNRWIQAGGAVRKVLQSDPVFQRHLGWVPQAQVDPGKIKPFPARKKPEVEWKATSASSHWRENDQPSPGSLWKIGSSVNTQSGDTAPLGSWVFCLDSAGRTIIGRVHELLLGQNSLITVERFVLGSQLHPVFGWPILRRPRGPEITEEGIQSFVVLPTTSVQHLCSAEHDCRQGDCKPTLKKQEFQEREATDRESSAIQHADDDHFILNLAALHNFARVCRALPRHLTALKPLIQDRVAFHKEASLKAQATRMTKRQQAAAKKREKAEAKKREAAEAEAAAQRAENAEEEEEEEESSREAADEDIAVVPHCAQSTRKRRRVIDSDSENSENESQEPEAVVVRQSTRQRRAPNRLDL
ncbi:hypothetical protein B0H14DRAFT_3701249 [Mycena olivaceomarginata]|nr:hypothetical protein B0H14DRAFT_3701249 [Mycena olivaceomarginata]